MRLKMARKSSVPSRHRLDGPPAIPEYAVVNAAPSAQSNGAMVNTPPPKGGGFGLRLEVGLACHATDLGYLENSHPAPAALVFDVHNPGLISDQ